MFHSQGRDLFNELHAAKHWDGILWSYASNLRFESCRKAADRIRLRDDSYRFNNSAIDSGRGWE